MYSRSITIYETFSKLLLLNLFAVLIKHYIYLTMKSSPKMILSVSSSYDAVLLHFVKHFLGIYIVTGLTVIM